MKWIPILEEYKSYHFRCSSCGQEVKDTEEALSYKYCPYCGEAVDPASEAKFRAPRPDFKVGRKYSGIIRIDLHGTGSWEHDYCTFTCTNVDPLVLETERKDMDGKKYMDQFVYYLENAGLLTDCFDLVFTKDLDEIGNEND